MNVINYKICSICVIVVVIERANPDIIGKCICFLVIASICIDLNFLYCHSHEN